MFSRNSVREKKASATIKKTIECATTRGAGREHDRQTSVVAPRKGRELFVFFNSISYAVTTAFFLFLSAFIADDGQTTCAIVLSSRHDADHKMSFLITVSPRALCCLYVKKKRGKRYALQTSFVILLRGFTLATA